MEVNSFWLIFFESVVSDPFISGDINSWFVSKSLPRRGLHRLGKDETKMAVKVKYLALMFDDGILNAETVLRTVQKIKIFLAALICKISTWKIAY